MTFWRGEVSYKEADEAGTLVEFGREDFSISQFPDDSRTMRAVCRYSTTGLIRDVTYTVGADFKPVECFVRVAMQTHVIGSAWFRFTDTTAEAEGFTAKEGRFKQCIPVPDRVVAFGSHPLCSDFWRLAHVKAENPGTAQVLSNCMNSSPAAPGDTGPMLFQREYSYNYVGEKTVTVPAGAFKTHQFDWAVRDGKTLRLWTTGPDYLPIRMDFPEKGNVYELMSLDIED
jgi:hypothetical protein